jgi:hypothetical protein
LRRRRRRRRRYTGGTQLVWANSQRRRNPILPMTMHAKYFHPMRSPSNRTCTQMMAKMMTRPDAAYTPRCSDAS